MTKLKCKYCNELIDKSKDEYEKVSGNRYAHKSCCTEDNVEYMKDKIKLYVRKQLGENYNAIKVNSQIKNYIDKLFLTPQQIYQALVYWYEVQKASPEKANGGIGIVSNI